MDSSYSIILTPANNCSNYCTSALHNRRREMRYYQSTLFFFSLLLMSYGLIISEVLILQVECPYYCDCPLLVFGLSIIDVLVLVNVNVVLLY